MPSAVNPVNVRNPANLNISLRIDSLKSNRSSFMSIRNAENWVSIFAKRRSMRVARMRKSLRVAGSFGQCSKSSARFCSGSFSTALPDVKVCIWHMCARKAEADLRIVTYPVLCLSSTNSQSQYRLSGGGCWQGQALATTQSAPAYCSQL